MRKPHTGVVRIGSADQFIRLEARTKLLNPALV
jgi:hypothetical protein